MLLVSGIAGCRSPQERIPIDWVNVRIRERFCGPHLMRHYFSAASPVEGNDPIGWPVSKMVSRLRGTVCRSGQIQRGDVLGVSALDEVASKLQARGELTAFLGPGVGDDDEPSDRFGGRDALIGLVHGDLHLS